MYIVRTDRLARWRPTVPSRISRDVCRWT